MKKMYTGVELRWHVVSSGDGGGPRRRGGGAAAAAAGARAAERAVGRQGRQAANGIRPTVRWPVAAAAEAPGSLGSED